MTTAKKRRTRTWPVFLAGIGSLLALLFLPGIVALRKTASVYHEIRQIQDSHRETQQLLADIERRVYLVSITVREALLDNSLTGSGAYKAAFIQRRREIGEKLAALKRHPVANRRTSLPRLESELEGYFEAIEPVLEWAPAERSARAMYFLREQQRPRRQSIIQIADEIGRLTEESYEKQLDLVNQSQIRFGQDIQRIIAVAFAIGLLIAFVTLYRMVSLEERAERDRVKTEKAEEELRSLSTRLMQAQEEERRSISRELHDEVGQLLTGLRMGLGGLDRLRESKEEFERKAGEIKSLAEQALRAVRDIAVGLRPSVLDLGLLPAVQWQARRFSTYSGLPATVNHEGDIENVPDEFSTCIYRVVQECLTNAARHARAKAVRIDIREVDRKLEVAVRDDGRGFDNRAVRGGLGLVGMEERVRELGGTLKVESAPATGTAVVVRLTLPDGAPSGNA